MAKTSVQTSMNVSLPVTLKRYVEKRVKSDGYSTPSEYMRELIRTDQQVREQKAALEVLLREGLAGPRTAATPNFWVDVRKHAHARAAQKKSAEKNVQHDGKKPLDHGRSGGGSRYFQHF